MTKREMVWRCIKQEGGPIGPADIAARLAMPIKVVSHCLTDLKRYNAMIIDGKARRTTYAIPKGARYQNPGTGSHPNSRAELVQWDWRKGLNAIREKQRGAPFVHHAPEPFLLDQFWPSMKKG
jgi:hypothetical protein